MPAECIAPDVMPTPQEMIERLRTGAVTLGSADLPALCLSAADVLEESTRKLDEEKNKRKGYALCQNCACRFDEDDEPISTCNWHRDAFAKLQQQLADCEEAYQDKARLWIEQTGAVAKLQQQLAEAQKALVIARDRLYNDFEPDNQSKAYHAVCAALESKTDDIR